MLTTKDSPPGTLLGGESLKLILSVSIGIFLLWLTPAAFASSTIVINEFSSQTSPDWVEIYNPTSQSIDLTTYSLSDVGNNSKTLSGSINSLGFITVDWSNKLNNSGDTIYLKQNDTIIDCVSYGDGAGNYCTGKSSPDTSAPLENQSAGRFPDDSQWNILSTISKGSTNNNSQLAPTSTPTPTLTPTPSPTPKPTSTPKPTATSTPIPADTPTPTSTPTSVLTSTDDNLSPQVLAETDENSQPEVNLDIIDLTATAESEINPSPTSQPEKSGRQTSPVFIISAAGAALMLLGGIPLFWLEFKSKKGIIFK